MYWKKTRDSGSKNKKARQFKNLLTIQCQRQSAHCLNVRAWMIQHIWRILLLFFALNKGTIKRRLWKPTPPTGQWRHYHYRGCMKATGLNLPPMAKITSLLPKAKAKTVHFSMKKMCAHGPNNTLVCVSNTESSEDKVIGMVCITSQDVNLLVSLRKGYGKRSSMEDYRITHGG